MCIFNKVIKFTGILKSTMALAVVVFLKPYNEKTSRYVQTEKIKLILDMCGFKSGYSFLGIIQCFTGKNRVLSQY